VASSAPRPGFLETSGSKRAGGCQFVRFKGGFGATLRQAASMALCTITSGVMAPMYRRHPSPSRVKPCGKCRTASRLRGLTPRRHPGVLAAMFSTPQPAPQIQVAATRCLNNQQCLRRSSARMRDQSRRRPSQVFSMELVQQLLEGFLSRLTGHRHGLKISRRLLYRASSPGTINLPPPRVRRRCPALHDN
jgi:hypothetical protein